MDIPTRDKIPCQITRQKEILPATEENASVPHSILSRGKTTTTPASPSTPHVTTSHNDDVSLPLVVVDNKEDCDLEDSQLPKTHLVKQRGVFVLTVCGERRYHCGSDLFGVQYNVRSMLMHGLQ